MGRVFLFFLTVGIWSCAAGGPEEIHRWRSELPAARDKTDLSARPDLKTADSVRAREAEGGRLDWASAAWWGFEAEDSTLYLQAAIDSGVRKVIIPDMGLPWITQPLLLRSNLEIVFAPGVVLLAKQGAFTQRKDHIFRIERAENVRLTGNGARLQMRKKEYEKKPYEESQHRHAIGIYSSRNIKIYGLAILSSGGDGIYMRGPETENIHIRDCFIADNFRQGISVISCRNLFIENSVIFDTSGHPPMAGIDFEPNRPTDRFENCLLRGCEFVNNRNAGVYLYLKRMSPDTAPISIVVDNCVIRDNWLFSVCVWGLAGGVRGGIRFYNTRVSGETSIDRSKYFQTGFFGQAPPDMPPQARAGGPYSLGPGERLRLDGGSSFDPDNIGGIIEWLWDIDNDGEFGDLSGDAPEISWEELKNTYQWKLNEEYVIKLKVQDDDYSWSEPSVTGIKIRDK